MAIHRIQPDIVKSPRLDNIQLIIVCRSMINNKLIIQKTSSGDSWWWYLCIHCSSIIFYIHHRFCKPCPHWLSSWHRCNALLYSCIGSPSIRHSSVTRTKHQFMLADDKTNVTVDGEVRIHIRINGIITNISALILKSSSASDQSNNTPTAIDSSQRIFDFSLRRIKAEQSSDGDICHRIRSIIATLDQFPDEVIRDKILFKMLNRRGALNLTATWVPQSINHRYASCSSWSSPQWPFQCSSNVQSSSQQILLASYAGYD